MTDAERVVFAFSARGKGSETVLQLDGAQRIAPSGEHLVRVRLVADVPHEPVVGRVEDIMQRDGEFDCAEPGGEVTAHLAHCVDEVPAQLAGHVRQLALRNRTQVGRRLESRKKRVRLNVVHYGAEAYRKVSGDTRSENRRCADE